MPPENTAARIGKTDTQTTIYKLNSLLINMKRSYIFIAPGFEEIEAVATLDVLRRAGMEVATVAITDGKTKTVTGAHGLTITADLLPDEEDMTSAEWLICPGGMPGATNLAASPDVTSLLKAHYAAGGKIAAICASPAVVLEPLGILDDREATCYPGMEPKNSKARMHESPVVALDNLITGNGPASTLRFALAIVKNSCGEQVAQEVGSAMLFYPRSMNFYF